MQPDFWPNSLVPVLEPTDETGVLSEQLFILDLPEVELSPTGPCTIFLSTFFSFETKLIFDKRLFTSVALIVLLSMDRFGTFSDRLFGLVCSELATVLSTERGFTSSFRGKTDVSAKYNLESIGSLV
ncbi:hypothetical protein V8G54_004090 [Vigna mungo]|uniref:Uncharacterized protein n=1 Tax=Vigna mungo TaxID=3915 RepID=A0AAQ3SEJ9_VIGMU